MCETQVYGASAEALTPLVPLLAGRPAHHPPQDRAFLADWGVETVVER